ncbi:hypothetical protein VPH35_140815 [Triticum aestivum]
MVLRDTTGQIIFSSCHHLFKCNNALEAELQACREGVALALEWSSLPFILKTDSTEAAMMLNQKNINRSPNACLVHEIKELLDSDREVVVRAVRRSRNRVSHELARIGRVDVKTAVWLRSGPNRVVELCEMDHSDPG